VPKHVDKHDRSYHIDWASFQYRFHAVKKKDLLRPFSF